MTRNATDAHTNEPLKAIRVVPASEPKFDPVMWQSQYLKTFESLPRKLHEQ